MQPLPQDGCCTSQKRATVLHMFLGVDPSPNHTALVVLDLDGSVLEDTVLNVPDDIRGPDRLTWLDMELELFLAHHTCALGVREAYSFGSIHQAFLIGEVSGLCTLHMRRVCTGYEECAPSALKKFATSIASAEKQTMIRAVERRWKYDARGNDNLADAYALAQVARALFLPDSSEWQRPQREVVRGIREPVTIKKARAASKRAARPSRHVL